MDNRLNLFTVFVFLLIALYPFHITSYNANTYSSKGILNELMYRYESDTMMVLSKRSVPAGKVFTVTATCYHPTVAQTDDSPLITGSRKHIDPSNPLKHRWIGVSQDLLRMGFKYGDKVLISGTCTYDGVWTIEDAMNKRWKYRIDFLIGKKDQIGSWKNIKITKIK